MVKKTKVPVKPGRKLVATMNRLMQEVRSATGQSINPLQTKSRNRRRRANKKGVSLQTYMAQGRPEYSPATNAEVAIYPQPQGVSSRTPVGSRIRNVKPRGKVSPEGEMFLKCAFSAADFDGSGTYGVPDDYAGKSLAMKYRNVSAFNCAATTDYYILVLPIPGYAYFTTAVTAGVAPVAGTVWTGVQYPNFASIFGTNVANVSQMVTKFRYVSQHIEMVPTTNANTWTGNVQVFKLPIQLADKSSDTAGVYTNTYKMTGISGVNGTDADMYTGPFNLGTYCGAFNRGGSSWDFAEILDGFTQWPENPLGSDFGIVAASTNAYLTGFDNNFESILLKISGIGSNANDSFLMKNWACVEYQFTPGTAMYEMQMNHVNCDEEAMRLYREVAINLPVGVSFLDNANFWNRVLAIIRRVSGSLSVLPGGYGMMAAGAHGIATGLEALTL